MIKLTLADGNKLAVHTGYKELSHAQYIDFQHGKLRYVRNLLEEEVDNFRPEIMAEALSAVVDGNLGTLPFMLEEDNLKDKDLPPLTEGISLYRLYLYYERLMQEYDPSGFDFTKQDYEYTYKGQRYTLTADRAYRVVSRNKVRWDTDPEELDSEGNPKPLQFTTLEVIEVNTLFHLLAKSQKQAKQDKASQTFSTDLMMLAILLRKPGEEIPIIKKERDAWLSQRAEHFVDIPNWVVKDVTFFLTNTSRVLEIALSTELSFMARKNLVSSGDLDAILREAMLRTTNKLLKKPIKST